MGESAATFTALSQNPCPGFDGKTPWRRERMTQYFMDTLVTKEQAPTSHFLKLGRRQTGILDRAIRFSTGRNEAQN